VTTPGTLQVDGLLLDMDGVLTMSAEALPGAADALARLHAADLPVRILTNTTAYTQATIGAALRERGLALADAEVLTAPLAAVAYLQARHAGARIFVLGDAQHDDLRPLHRVGLDEQPDVVLVSGADESFDFHTLNRVFRLLLDGAALVTMHRNLSWMTAKGERLDSGAYLLGLEQAAGCRAAVAGKPDPAFFAAGLASLGLEAAQVAMVGDDVDNDVLAAQAAGMAGVLVRTGKFRQERVDAAPGRPEHILASIIELPALLGI
jgi:HAD superfamily hydrolase (TIGR01458 family)